MNPLLFFNNQQINQPYDFTTLDITNGVAIFRWDYSVHALQSIVYCLVERQSFFVGSSTWSSSFYEQFLSLINAHGCPNGACLIATSGTAGAPKLCVQPITNLFLSAERAISNLPMANDAEFVMALPPVAMGGLLTIVKALSLHCPLHLCSGHWLTVLADLKYPSLAMVPQQLPKLAQYLINHPQQLHSLLIGGDELSIDYKKALSTIYCPKSVSYGATETAGQIMASPYVLDVSDSLFPLDGVSIDVTESDQLLIKAPTLALGYLTSNGLTPLPFNSDDFFISNDVVELKPSFKVIGRIDFQFKSGGQMVNPEMIEAAFKSSGLIQHMLVVPLKDEKLGMAPIAYIKDLATQEVLSKFALEQLPIHLRPLTYCLLPEGFSFSDPWLRRKLLQHLNG